jgi:hypothetical protein
MNLFDLFPKLSEKRVTLNSLDVPYRVFVNWSDNGIIDYQVSESATKKEVTRKRVELNYFEALWVLIIKELRVLGLSLKDLKELKSYLLSPIDTSHFESLSDDVSIELFKKLLPQELNNIISEENIFTKEKIQNYLGNIPEAYKLYFTNIGGLVNSVLLLGQSPTLILNRNPLQESEQTKFSFHIFNPIAQVLEAEMNGRDFRDEIVTNLIHFSIVNIPIVPLVSKFYQDEALYKYTSIFALYTPGELELLKILKQKDFKQIKIFKSHNNKTFELEITNEKDLKNHEAKTLKTLIGLKQYERAEIIFRNDKHLVIKNIIRKQI